MTTLRPQIINSQRTTASFTSPEGSRTAVVIGTATWGPVNELTTVGSLSKFISKFGDDKSGNSITGIKAAELLFRNGGTMKFLRIADSNAAKASNTFQSSSTDVIKIEALHNGTKGNNILVTINDNDSNRDVLITDGVLSERYTNGGNGFANNEDIVEAINNSSQLVKANIEGSNETTNLVDDATQTQLTGGDDGDSSLTDSDYTDAFDNYLATETFNFLLIPGKTDDSFQSSIATKIETKATDEKERSRYITGVDVDETISTISARTTTSKRMTLVAPNVKYTHRVDDSTDVLDGSYLACAYAGVLSQLDIEVSGTHETVNVDGLSVNSASNKQYYSKIEQDELLENSVAPVAKINDTNQMVRGVTTIANTSDINYEEVVVDIIDEITTRIEDYLNSVIGKPNTPDRRSIYTERVNSILQIALNQGIIQEYGDSSITEGDSPDTIDADISIRPSYNTNFVNLQITVN